jgi:hypothetical protein
MARGAEAKTKIQKQILETFPGSFLYNDGKEIRIPTPEGGEMVQIKVTLTCAKENVEMGADAAMPGDFPAPKMTAPTPQRDTPVAPSAEEKANVAALLQSLGL